MHKAISIIQFKLEGQLIKKHSPFDMDDRLLLHKIDYEKGTVRIDGVEYRLIDTVTIAATLIKAVLQLLFYIPL